MKLWYLHYIPHKAHEDCVVPDIHEQPKLQFLTSSSILLTSFLFLKLVTSLIDSSFILAKTLYAPKKKKKVIMCCIAERD